MFSTADISKHTTLQRKPQNVQPAFFRKAGEGVMDQPVRQPFFSPSIQTKLSVSSPDDPQEKEADAMANKVMRMPEPAVSVSAKEEDNKLQRMEEEEEAAQTSLESDAIHRKCENCEEEEKVQAKLFSFIQRNEDADAASHDAAGDESESNYSIDRKSLSIHRSDVMQLSGRGPPANSMQGSFEQNLSSSKGGGSAMPNDTRSFMESRFQADFSGVRIHTGSHAETLSRSIQAQAFTHGNDIYFNSGKYNPGSESGGTLLAHELTHTIQQGASQPVAPSGVSKKSQTINPKIQRSAAGVPTQLTNAVEKAKTMEGKIDANKPQADGNRTGYDHLIDIFKTTFGPDMVVSGGGGTSVQGAVAEQDIKKKRMTTGMIVDKSTITDRDKIPGTTTGERDAMPSWCGIFVFWALNKSGVPMPKWKLGDRMIPPESARAPGTMPLPGDIAYRNAYSHYAIVESVNGATVKTVNGNTAGEDNLGGQVQAKDHPLSEWTAFFNPLQIMTGPLGNGEVSGDAKPKSISELRAQQGIQTKEEEVAEEANAQAKPELSSWNVSPDGSLHNSSSPVQKSTEPEVQAAEEKEEEEIKGAGVQKDLQKKSDDAFDNESCCSHSEAGNASDRSSNVQAKEISSHNVQSSATFSAEPVMSQDRGPPVRVQTCKQNKIQRTPIDDALAHTSLSQLLDCVYVTDIDRTSLCLLRKASQLAMYVPGYKALRVVLARDPITGDRVIRNGHNLLDAAFDIMPGGEYFKQKLKQTGQLDAAAEWVDTKIAGLEDIVDNLFTRFDNFWNDLGITDFRSPMDVLRRGFNIVYEFIRDLINFAINAAKELLSMVKDYLLSKIVEFIKTKTTAYPLLVLILGEDPITKETVEPTGANILNAILELGGEEGRNQRTQMRDTGTFDKVAAYIDEGILVFSDLYNTILNGFNTIWDIISINALMEPTATFQRIYNVFAQPVKRVLDFMKRVAIEILRLIKEALMSRLSTWARTVRGYDLVTVIIGKDPFTEAVVPFTMENVIKGFFGLMDGGIEQYNQLKESGAIDRTVAKVTKAVRKLNMTPAAIVQVFIGLWNSFSIQDLIHPIEAFRRILAEFGEPIGRLIAFVIEIVKIVIEAILIVMNFPFDLVNNIIAKAMQAFQRIKRDPVGFLKNLLKAIKQGFVQFFDNILKHLLGGLADWVFFQLKDLGIQKPEDLTFKSILKLVMEVLGVSLQMIMDKVWKKLEEKIGKEKVEKIKRVIDKLEGIWKFIKDVMERGPVAIWEFIQEKLSDLWNMILDAAKNFIMERIVNAVITKLLSMLDPTGIMAVVNSVIAIYKAIQSFIAYLRQMLEIVNSFVEGVAEIAAGNIKVAADYVERSAARAIPIIIGFLANQVGLGKIADKLKEIIMAIREKIDKAVDWLVDKAVNMGMAILNKLVGMAKSAKDAVLGWLGMKKQFTSQNGQNHKMYFKKQGNSGELIIESNPTPVSKFLKDLKKSVPKDTSLDDGKKAQVLAKIGQAETLVKKIGELTHPNDRDAKPSDTAELEILEKSESLIAIIKEIDPAGASGVIPAPQFLPGFTNGSRGQLFEVKYVSDHPTKNYPKGEAAGKYKGNLSGALTLLEKLGVRAKWVAFHIVNENYGGKAVDSNLVPTPQYINKDYRAQFEDKLKEKLAKKIPIWMIFNSTYKGSRPFLDSLTANGGGMKFESNQWIEDPAEKVPTYSAKVDEPIAETIAVNELVNDPDLWYFYEKETPLERASLNFLADEVKKGIRFTSKQHIKTHMEANFIPSTTAKGRKTTILNQVENANLTF